MNPTLAMVIGAVAGLVVGVLAGIILRKKIAEGKIGEIIDIVNEKIMVAARQKQIYYVDVDTIFRDAEGYLPADYSNDGVHLNSPYVRQFRDYLLTHTVEVK